MVDRKIAILQSNYIPWKGYFDLIAKSDTFVIYDEVQYTKNDWRNRNLIKTTNGPEWITIPVRQISLDQKIEETKITTHHWAKKHVSTLQGNYSKSPFFKSYKDAIFSLYEIKSEYISEINLSFIKGICKLLDINTDIIRSNELNLHGDKNSRLLEACKKLGATTYISGPSAKNYLNVELFDDANIKVDWMDYSDYKEYNQLFPPFQHGVTILDLIFNLGPQAKDYLKYTSR
jgi:hypothetical protein